MPLFIFLLALENDLREVEKSRDLYQPVEYKHLANPRSTGF